MAQEEQRNYAVRVKKGKWREESVLPKALSSKKVGGKKKKKSGSTIRTCFETLKRNCAVAATAITKKEQMVVCCSRSKEK